MTAIKEPGLSSYRRVPPRSAADISVHGAAEKFKKPEVTDRDPASRPPTLPPAIRQSLHSPAHFAERPQAKTSAPRQQSYGRLPAAWYRDRADSKASKAGAFLSTSVKAAIGGALLGSVAGLAWLSAQSASHAPKSHAQPIAAFSSEPITLPLEPVSNAINVDDIPTAQILAVAERFIAFRDILAARAALAAKASSGDAQAKFALAETYDPNMLKFWNASAIPGNVVYARELYQSALRAGVADAQARLEVLH